MTSTGRAVFPFSAIVGSEQLLHALVLCAIQPQIGGVLIRGEKGSAKTTAVRGLSKTLRLLEDAPLVELPIGATEDRVVGSVDLTRILRDGESAFSPGLLAQADGGMLYVDEVNLLPDHLVDVLLDAAASGWVTVERDSISYAHESRFMLVGTMNPEEGELRPQLLDRFGLTVEVRGTRDVASRAEIVRRRMAFEAGRDAFAEQYASREESVARQVAAARARLADVVLPDAELERIATVCAAFDVDGLRADIVIANTAIANAAWRGADTVSTEDIRIAAELALPHRQRRDPFDEPGLDSAQLDRALQEPGPDSEPDPDPPTGGREVDADPEPGAPTTAPDHRPNGTKPSAPPSAPFRTPTFRVPGVGDGAPGRRSRARTATGSTVSATSDLAAGHGIHLFATVLACAGRTAGTGGLTIDADDLRSALRVGREANLVVFVVDASGSMAARDRMAAVGGAAVSLLRDAYQRRDKVAVITFRDDHADLILPPTSSTHIAHRRLQSFTTGGRTPLDKGLLKARDLIVRERVHDPVRRPIVVVLTDGRATGGVDPLGRARAAAEALAAESAAAVVVDCENSRLRLGLANVLGRRLGGPTITLDQLHVAVVGSRRPRAA